MKRPLLAAIRFYQRNVSPGMAPACRFQPTCSHYAHDAIETHGAVIGSAKALWRLLRCNPLNDGGYDPVAGSRGSATVEIVPRETIIADEHPEDAPNTTQPKRPVDRSPA